MDSKGPNVFPNKLFLGWVAGYGIFVVGWINIQPREGGLEMQQVGKPRENFTFSYLLLYLLPTLGVGGAKKGISILKRGTYNHFWWNNYHSLFPSK